MQGDSMAVMAIPFRSSHMVQRQSQCKPFQIRPEKPRLRHTIFQRYVIVCSGKRLYAQ